jgi:hypothetical protein
LTVFENIRLQNNEALPPTKNTNKFYNLENWFTTFRAGNRIQEAYALGFLRKLKPLKKDHRFCGLEFEHTKNFLV